MKRSFRKGELVRSNDGKILEVMYYIGNKLVQVQWFDNYSKEVYRNILPECRLSKVN